MKLHPIVEQIGPSPEQQPAVDKRGRDIVVTAGAGTGKTRTLVARYLSLLADDWPLRAIVAITFTKKAAREMRNRVREEMRRYLSSELEAAERARWQDLYGELDAARIGTIHSLCTEILRAHPAEAEVDPRFEVLDEGQTNILRARALDEALGWAADDQAAAKLFALFGERDLRSTLGLLLAQRLVVQETLASLPTDLLGHWERVLSTRQEQGLDALLNTSEWLDAVAILQTSEAVNPDDRMEIQRQAARQVMRDAAGSLKDRLAALARLDRIDLRGGSKKSWPDGKEQLDEVKGALRTLRDRWRQAADLLGLALIEQDQRLARAMPSLQAMFEYACQRYFLFKRERNALDFDDLEHDALDLLRKDKSVLTRWQQELEAILVDEFQDTNGRQRDLVTLLNGNQGRLFIVGDAKQSIYRFRGADVTVFRDERRRVEQGGGCAYSLDTSYRAHSALLSGLNTFLRPVLGEREDPARPWVEPFAPLNPHRELPGPGFEVPHIELHLTVGSKGEGALRQAAVAVVGRIVELVESGAQIVEDGEPRAMSYGDIAILCRASGSFPAYEDALEKAQLPFLTVAGRGFYGRPEIRDLLNALQALADPTDDLALTGLLRSPAMGLSDLALYTLCQERDGRAGRPSLWEVLSSSKTEFLGAEALQAQRAVELVARLNKQVGRMPVADLIKILYDRTDYRPALIQAGQARAARNAAKLLADAHASGIVGVGEFLEYVNSLRDTGVREGEARAAAEGAVQVMSVHAAKGLEFPVVVIGDIGYSGPTRRSTLVDPELGILFPLKDDDDQYPTMYQLGKLHEEDQERAELDRLLYVATTRAREKLILNGCMSLNRSGKPSRLAGWLARVSQPDVLGLANLVVAPEGELNMATSLDLCVGETPVTCTIYPLQSTSSLDDSSHARKRRSPSVMTEDEVSVGFPPSLLDPVSPLLEQMDERTVAEDRSPPQRVWQVVPRAKQPTAPAWVIGSLVHEALAAWRFPTDGFEQWIQARARGYGITDPHQLTHAVCQSRQLLSRFQDHDLFGEMEAADQRLHEVPFSLLTDGQVESGIIDALFQKNSDWIIVEFKTDDVKNEAKFRQLLDEQDYLSQVERYQMAADRLLGLRPRAVLCMLNFAGEVRLFWMDEE